MSRQSENTRDWQSSSWVFVLMVVVVLALMVAGYCWVWSLVPADDWNTFADVYGAVVGTLFAGLAFAGIIWTIMLQRHELALQRRELEATRAELKGQREAQEGSEKALKAQEKALQAQVYTAKLAARLNAAVAIVEHYDKLAANLPPDDTPPKEGEERYNILEGRKDMQNELFRVRNELVGPVQAVGAVTGVPGTASGTGEAGSPNAERPGAVEGRGGSAESPGDAPGAADGPMVRAVRWVERRLRGGGRSG